MKIVRPHLSTVGWFKVIGVAQPRHSLTKCSSVNWSVNIETNWDCMGSVLFKVRASPKMSIASNRAFSSWQSNVQIVKHIAQIFAVNTTDGYYNCSGSV